MNSKHLPLLASLLKSYKPIVQIMLVRKTALKIDEVTVVLDKNEQDVKK